MNDDAIFCLSCGAAAPEAATMEAVEQSQTPAAKNSNKLIFIILGVAALAGIFWLAPNCYREARSLSSVGLSCGEYLRELVLRLIRLWSLPVAAALIARRRGPMGLLVPAGILTFVYFTVEAWLFGRVFVPELKTGSVTIAWTALAFAGLFAGIVRRVKLARTLSLSLLGVSVAKLLFVDTAHLATPSRVALFALTGVVLLIGAFLYIKYQNLFADDADGKESK